MNNNNKIVTNIYDKMRFASKMKTYLRRIFRYYKFSKERIKRRFIAGRSYIKAVQNEQRTGVYKRNNEKQKKKNNILAGRNEAVGKPKVFHKFIKKPRIRRKLKVYHDPKKKQQFDYSLPSIVIGDRRFFASDNRRVITTLRSVYGLGYYKIVRSLHCLGFNHNVRFHHLNFFQQKKIYTFFLKTRKKDLLGRSLHRIRLENLAIQGRLKTYKFRRFTQGMPMRNQRTRSNASISRARPRSIDQFTKSVRF